MSNELTGLDLDGFKDEDIEFDPVCIEDKNILDSARAIIQKYFCKKSSFNRKFDSYALMRLIERTSRIYIPNGLLIYAMHLEGFKIKRDRYTVYGFVLDDKIRTLF